jgi:NADPH-dependent 2,4-dienoyl-CoA reductase/sulfur reductase-like enzyme
MKLLIVGGLAGGASAAARARRLSENAEIILFERGPDVSFANCGLPYYLGGEIAERDKLLVVTPQRGGRTVAGGTPAGRCRHRPGCCS